MKNTKFENAINAFANTLRKDGEMYYAYQSNIAMAFVDESRRQNSRDSYKKLHKVANQAAKNFLDLLISKTPEDFLKRQKGNCSETK